MACHSLCAHTATSTSLQSISAERKLLKGKRKWRAHAWGLILARPSQQQLWLSHFLRSSPVDPSLGPGPLCLIPERVGFAPAHVPVESTTCACMRRTTQVGGRCLAAASLFMRGARSTWPKAGNDVHGSASFRASARAEARCARVPGLSELQKAWSTQGAGSVSSAGYAQYLRFLASQWHLLRQHFVGNKERLRDKQRRLELSRSSIGRYVSQVLRVAVKETPPGTPLVVTLGADLSFSPLKGKPSTPSTAIEQGFIRGMNAGAGGCGAIDRHMVWVSEYHTSKHCFRCGAETGGAGECNDSYRLQACAECSWNLQERRTARKKPVVVEPKKLRAWTVDRDVQGALNIAFIGVAWFTKQPRPYHLCTPDVQRAWEKLACRENMQECNQSAPPHFSLH